MTVPTVPEPQAPSPFLDLAHERLARRAEPRASIALAGGGCVLAIVGVLVLAGDLGVDDGGQLDRWPGLIMSVVVVAIGLALLEVVRRGPLAAAGTVAAALGVPAVLFFLTFKDSSLPPYSTDAVLIGSTLAWLAAYAIGPGRGRPFLLGAGAIGLWASVLQLTENLFEAPFQLASFYSATLFGSGDTSTIDPVTGEIIPSTGSFVEPTFHTPDATTIGLISLVFGIAFLVGSRWLDRTGRSGAATPLLVAAFPALLVSVIALADDLDTVGSGLLLMLIGAGLLFHGSTAVRRATTWIGAAVATLGLLLVLSEAADDATTGGILFILGGIAVVAAAHLLARATNEPDELLAVGAGWHVNGPGRTRRQVAPSSPDDLPTPPPESDASDDWAPPASPDPDADA